MQRCSPSCCSATFLLHLSHQPGCDVRWLHVPLIFWCNSFDSAGSRPREPARGSLHQRQTSTQPHPSQDRGDGSPRHQAVRHLPAAPRLPRLRVQNPLPVPGDGIHPTRSHRRQQTQGSLRLRAGCWRIRCCKWCVITAHTRWKLENKHGDSSDPWSREQRLTWRRE